ncbi:MAG TPA: hydrolase [Thermodesulfovibrionales bacterium]|nr:hydrolase [Thermodesulfovibrionales bacterium]
MIQRDPDTTPGRLSGSLFVESIANFMERFFLIRGEVILAIVDIQDKLAAVMGEREKVIANTLHLVEAAKIFKIPMVLTEQYPKGLGPTVGEVRTALASYEPIEKTDFGCCREAAFLRSLSSSGKKKVILAGMETHICVLQTCLGLLKEGYAVHVVSDAVCSRARGNHTTGIEFMRDAGAVITGTETVLFQLLEKAGTEEFRMISRRIK